jgi:hypothetical protein
LPANAFSLQQPLTRGFLNTLKMLGEVVSVCHYSWWALNTTLPKWNALATVEAFVVSLNTFLREYLAAGFRRSFCKARW